MMKVLMKKALSFLLAVSMVLLLLTGAGPVRWIRLTPAARAAGIKAIDITNPDCGDWTPIYPANGQHDPAGDTRAGGGKGSQDIVGNGELHGSAASAVYMQSNADEIAIRIRVGGVDGGTNVNNYEFKNFAYIGVDADLDGRIDFFMGVYNPSGSGRLAIYGADPTALNAGPSSTGITKAIAAFQPVRGVNYSILPAGTDYAIASKKQSKKTRSQESEVRSQNILSP